MSFTSIFFAISLTLPLAQSFLIIASHFKKYLAICHFLFLKDYEALVKPTFVTFERTFYCVILKTAACISGAVLLSCR